VTIPRFFYSGTDLYDSAEELLCFPVRYSRREQPPLDPHIPLIRGPARAFFFPFGMIPFNARTRLLNLPFRGLLEISNMPKDPPGTRLLCTRRSSRLMRFIRREWSPSLSAAFSSLPPLCRKPQRKLLFFSYFCAFAPDFLNVWFHCPVFRSCQMHLPSYLLVLAFDMVN